MPTPLLPAINVELASRAVVLIWLYVLLRILRKNRYLSALLWWGGTVGHELCHYIVGFLWGAKPTSIEFTPRRDRSSGALILGSVTFANLRWWNKLPVATAPLLLLILGWWIFLQSTSYPVLSLTSFLLNLAALQCVEGFWPSGTDWRHARETIYVLLTLILGLGGLYYYALM